MKTIPQSVIDARRSHHYALERICTIKDNLSDGLTIYRRLRRLEIKMHDAALERCNNPRYTASQWEACKEYICQHVKAILGDLPPGFFINTDPIGYALKLEPGSVSANLHTDFGGYQILAPEID